MNVCKLYGLFVVVAVSVFMADVQGTVVSLDNTQTLTSGSNVYFDEGSCFIDNIGPLENVAPILDWVLFNANSGSRVELAGSDIIGSQSGTVIENTLSGLNLDWESGTPVASGTSGEGVHYNPVTGFTFSWTIPETQQGEPVYFYFIARANGDAENYADVAITVGEESTQTFTDVFTSALPTLLTFSLTEFSVGDEVEVTMSNSIGYNFVPIAAVVSAEVPEPMTAGLLLAGGVLFATLRRRRH